MTEPNPRDFQCLWPLVEQHTLLHRYKARMLHTLVEATMNLGAAVAECGVFRGGMTLMMAKQLAGTSRKVLAFDSFAGLPPWRSYWETAYYQTGALCADEHKVRKLFKDNHVDGLIDLRPGLFEETLAGGKDIPPLGLVHIDGDVYSSVKTCIERLYDKIVPGGIMVIDDYNDLGGGAEQAVTEHLDRTDELLYIGPIEQVFIVKGRMRSDDARVYVGWKPVKSDKLRAISGKDYSVVVRDAEYLRDLNSGEAVPDLPGHSLEELEKLGRRMLKVWGHHREVLLKSACER
jgi:hypothetical protein